MWMGIIMQQDGAMPSVGLLGHFVLDLGMQIPKHLTVMVCTNSVVM
jgi:hypothetical protein